MSGREKVQSIRECVLADAAAAEAARTMTPAIVDAMWASGLMHYMNPAEAGGDEPSFRDMIDTLIDMAYLDGSFGWTGLANFSSTAAAAAFLPDAGFKEVFGGSDHHTTIGGQLAPNGSGTVVDGGVRLTGSWNFGSGTGHAAYVGAGFLPIVDGEMVWMTPEMPLLRVAIVPREDVTFTDGWFVQGLKGTGSYDYNMQDVFVPEHRTFDLFTRDAQRGGAPTYRMGLMPMTAAGHAAWALGVSKSMLDDVVELAQSRVRMGDLSTIAHRESFQRGFAHHDAMWTAARLLVVDVFSAMAEAVGRGEEFAPRMRADGRAAAVYATECAREIAQWAHLAAGTTAIREGSRLERAFRDLYTGTQHAFINEKVAILAAQVQLGIAEDHFSL